jgi:hypothetical protein
MSVSTFAHFVNTVHKERKFKRINLESNTQGKPSNSELMRLAGTEERIAPSVHAVATDTDKVVRVMGYQHLIENGTIKFKSGKSQGCRAY